MRRYLVLDLINRSTNTRNMSTKRLTGHQKRARKSQDQTVVEKAWLTLYHCRALHGRISRTESRSRRRSRALIGFHLQRGRIAQ